MSINVLPHKKFDEWMADFQLDDSHPPMNDEAVISICCTPDIKHNYLEGHKHETDEHWFKQNHSNVLNIDFDDITCPVQKTKYGTAYGITDEQADTIVRFINDHIETDNWYIHCRAGRCRSVAVGLFVAEFLKKHGQHLHFHTSRLITYQNLFVAQKLREAETRINDRL